MWPGGALPLDNQPLIIQNSGRDSRRHKESSCIAVKWLRSHIKWQTRTRLNHLELRSAMFLN